MIELIQKRVEVVRTPMTSDEAKQVTLQYLKTIIGEDCYITNKGKLEHWTRFPHGSGTTTELGDPSKLQILAWELIRLIEIFEILEVEQYALPLQM